MRLRDFHGFALALLLAGSAAAATVDFDDPRAGRPGQPSGACGALYEVDDEYLGLGVRFASTDPAVCVLESGNAPSPLNVVSGIAANGNIDFSAPIIASFFAGAAAAAVASVTLELTTGSFSTTVEAYDVNGALLGSSGRTGAGTHLLSFPQRIHSVHIANGAFAMDDFSFTAPGPPHLVPGLSLAARIVMSALLATVGLRGLRRIG